MTLRERTRVAFDWAAPILLGMFVTAAGVAPWLLMATLNAKFHPEIPWAAGGTLVWLILYIWWLNGGGPPAKWQAARRYRLRLWRTGSNGWSRDGIGVTLALMGAIGVLTVLWIAIGAPEQVPDTSRYHTTAYLVSVVVMGPLVSGITEEAGYRGYMQRGLERFGAGPALVVTAATFAIAHGVHGITMLLTLGPGIFVAGIIYGLLARHTGSILPGMLVHFLGDLAFTYFGVLDGNWRLLIVS